MKKLLTILMAFVLVIGMIPIQYAQAKSIKIKPSNSAKTAPKLENTGTYKLTTPLKKSNTYFQFVAPETGKYEFIFYDMRLDYEQNYRDPDDYQIIKHEAPSKIYFSRTGKNGFKPISLGKDNSGKDINFMRFASLEFRALLSEDICAGVAYGADVQAYSDSQLKEAAINPIGYALKENDGKLRCTQTFNCDKGKKIYVKVYCDYGTNYKLKIKKI